MALEFANKALNKDFEILTEDDANIKTPDGFDCKLTDVPNASILQGMIKRKSTLVGVKVTATASTKKPDPTESAK